MAGTAQRMTIQGGTCARSKVDTYSQMMTRNVRFVTMNDTMATKLLAFLCFAMPWLSSYFEHPHLFPAVVDYSTY